MKFRPLHDRVVVKRIDGPNTGLNVQRLNWKFFRPMA